MWKQAILLVDMNAFFASVEQRDFPELRSKLVAVTNGELGSCIITCSYEARAQGIKTGMRLKTAIEKCPTLIRRPARPQVYAQTSSAIMSALAENISPNIEVFSVDEAFIDITDGQQWIGSIKEIAQSAKDVVWQASGLLCSVGASGDKTTAKYAAKLNKPNGLTIIEPWNSEKTLYNVAVEELCGINKGIGQYLNVRGVYTCGDMKKLPISALGSRFGNIGRRIWLMAQGQDPEGINPNIDPPKSIGHGKVLPPDTTDFKIVQTFLFHMSEKVAYRLRKNQMLSDHFFVGLRLSKHWIKTKFRTMPTDTSSTIFSSIKLFLKHSWRKQGVHAVQVTALNPVPKTNQQDLFANIETSATDKVLDEINGRYGQYTLTKATLLERSTMPDVIAPAWKPSGHRQTIE